MTARARRASGLPPLMADCAAAPALYYARVVHRWDEDGLFNLTRYFEALTARRPWPASSTRRASTARSFHCPGPTT